MATVTIEEVLASLVDLTHRLKPDEKIVMTENKQPVARLVAAAVEQMQWRLGTVRGAVLYTAPGFDTPLEDFKEHLPSLFRL